MVKGPGSTIALVNPCAPSTNDAELAYLMSRLRSYGEIAKTPAARNALMVLAGDRSPGRPAEDDVAALARMHELVDKGLSRRSAATILARASTGEAKPESVRRRLMRKFSDTRFRHALRP